jgi:ferredoxin
MKRKIINIDEKKCNGCRLCIPNCPEGAIQIIDGKARLISDLFCDGLGACLGHCPEGAITIEEREAEPYEERKVMKNVVKQGENVVKAHLLHLKDHNEHEFLAQAVGYLKEKGMTVPNLEENPTHHAPPKGCPGAAAMDMRHRHRPSTPSAPSTTAAKPQSQLMNWPVQLQLLNPRASYLKDAHLLVSADCVPYAFPNFHERFLKGNVLVTFCPKLDQTLEQYIEKLAVIFETANIQSVSVLHMEVPCCSGTTAIVQKALQKANKVIPIKDYTISISGEIV